jgi:Acetyltransferase (GNAT) domain/Domain of unknown function (DUF4037)
VGYLFVRRFWHQGLATEAARGTMKYAREQLGYNRLISLIRPENMPSRRVAGRNDLVPEKEITYKGYKHLVYVSEPNVSNTLDLAQDIANHLGKIKGIEAVALNLITKFGEWGTWVNGGGWLNINECSVDWLYRDISFVSRVINDCRSGKTSCYYYPGHPHGFHDHYYLSEIYYCRVLYDPKNVLTSFKEQVKQYPPLLKKTLVEKYLWEASFSLQTSIKAAKREDIFYVNGCLFRCVACLIQVLFALNERYINNEKGAIQIADAFLLRPNNFKAIVSTILAHSGNNEHELLGNIKRLESLVEETKKLSIIK